MKKPNHKAKSPLQFESKPAEDKPVDHHLESLELERQHATRRPTVFELAQITAVLIPSAAWKDRLILDENRNHDHPKAISPEDCAMDVWERCSKEIITRIDASIMLHRVKAFQGPAWLKTLRQETFPVPFEKALVIIVSKNRKLERYKSFRDFVRCDLLKIDKDKSSIDSRVEEKFKKLKSDGVSCGQIEDFRMQFDSWNAARPGNKAKKAAAARWKKT
jgi:hypothetical protein